MGTDGRARKRVAPDLRPDVGLGSDGGFARIAPIVSPPTAGHQPQVNQIGKKDRADGRAAVIRGRHRVPAEPDDEKPCEHDQDHDDGQGLPKSPATKGSLPMVLLSFACTTDPTTRPSTGVKPSNRLKNRRRQPGSSNSRSRGRDRRELGQRFKPKP